MAIPGDRRAWDARIVVGGRRAGCEAEMQLLDLQALERRLALKLRDGDVEILLLVVAEHRPGTGRSCGFIAKSCGRSFPWIPARSSRASGQGPFLPASGIVVL